jgi:transposase
MTQRGGVMMQTKTRSYECSGSPRQLLMAFELGEQCWKVGFTTGQGGRVRTRRIAAGALGVLVTEIAKAKAICGLAPDVPVISCYEAGRDGFWLHRYVVAQGGTNYVVDSASIEVNRRARRTKTDAVDLRGLLSLLARYVAGERHCWRVVRVPSLADEDARQVHRTWETLQADRTRVVNRLKGLLATHGVRLTMTADFLAQVAATRLWDGSELPPGARDRLARDWAQFQALEQQLREVAAARAALQIDLTTPTGRAVRALQTLRAIGPTGSWVLATELFGWREIRNGRQLGALVGLVPALYQSGETRHDRGITRAGNDHVRRIMVQLAWGWLRWQPDSALAQWYERRFASGGPRMRRIGIVALARKLLIALWRYVDQGVLPDGARLKPAA